MGVAEGKKLEAVAGRDRVDDRHPARIRRFWAALPRVEVGLLLIALACTLYGKLHVLRGGPSTGLFISRVWLSDIAFFSVVSFLIALSYKIFSWRIVSRLAVVVSVLIVVWSAGNMAWLVATGVQIHVDVFASLLRDPAEFGPIVTNRLVHSPRFSIPLLLVAVVLTAIVAIRLVRPERAARHSVRALLPSAIVAGLSCAAAWSVSALSTSPRLAALSYSSHWFGLTSVFGIRSASIGDEEIGSRRVPRLGERRINAPSRNRPRPHVVMVVMESVAHWSTSLGGQPPNQTPALVEIAQQGVLFETTRALVTHTTQSQFSMLTGVSPVLDGGFVEAVLVDSPYESFATILESTGYKTRFSQMVRATFECNPGLVANLGFDSFWTREDLQDPSTHLGYFAGDDCKMIEPAFDWFDQQDEPCFMLFMSSVAHHPYEVPAWYGPAMDDPKEAFLQTVRYTDAFLKAIVDQLKKREIYDDTLLCVLSDHGEGFGEHDVMQHGANPYEEALRIPWVIRYPKSLQEGRIVGAPCSLLDVTPTILSILGFDISNAGFEGRDALSRTAADRKMRFSGWTPRDPSGIVQGNQKTVYWPSLDRAYRYDLVRDPGESNPVLVDESQTERIRRELTDWRAGSRITFGAKRYRKRFLFGRWQVFSLGNTAWCYHVPQRMRDPR
ncbi:MAG: sulfatase-like hydrolase/transferase [Planctomycetota bacterium]|nr:sulfatase-like hydrolase/transferase [Planctomycetota bacterium]